MKVVLEKKNRISRNLIFSIFCLFLEKLSAKKWYTSGHIISARARSGFFTPSKIQTAPLTSSFCFIIRPPQAHLRTTCIFSQTFWSGNPPICSLFNTMFLLVVNTLVTHISFIGTVPTQEQGKLEHNTGTADWAEKSNSPSAKSCQEQNGKQSIFKH